MGKGGSHYYNYIAVKRDSKEALYRLKLEIDYTLKKETSLYKLIPELFSYMLSREKLVEEFVEHIKKENRIDTILKQPTGVKNGQV